MSELNYDSTQLVVKVVRDPCLPLVVPMHRGTRGVHDPVTRSRPFRMSIDGIVHASWVSDTSQDSCLGRSGMPTRPRAPVPKATGSRTLPYYSGFSSTWDASDMTSAAICRISRAATCWQTAICQFWSGASLPSHQRLRATCGGVRSNHSESFRVAEARHWLSGRTRVPNLPNRTLGGPVRRRFWRARKPAVLSTNVTRDQERIRGACRVPSRAFLGRSYRNVVRAWLRELSS